MANLEEVPGGRAVRRWVDADPERSYRALAAAIGVTTQSLYEWRFGISVPEPLHRELIEAATGVAPSRWSTAEERREARQHARKLKRLRDHGAMVSKLTGPRKPADLRRSTRPGSARSARAR